MSTFYELIDKYCANMDRQKELDASLFCDAGREEWIGKLRARSAEYEELNQENNSIIREILECVNQPLDADTALNYHKRIKDMYNAGYDETEIIIPVLERIASFPISNQGLVTLHSELYFEENVIKANALGENFNDVSHLEFIIKAFDKYEEFEENTRYAMWGNYFNYAIAALEDNSDVNVSCRRIRDLYALWKTPKIQELDGKNERFIDEIDGIMQEWLGSVAYMDLASEETKEYFCELAREQFESKCSKLENSLEYSNEIYAAYLMSFAFRGEKDIDEVAEEYYNYYEKRCQEYENVHTEDGDLEKFYFATNTPLLLEQVCQHIKDESLKNRIIRSLINNTKKTWYSQQLQGFDPVINSMLREWCFKMTSYMSSQAEKIDWITELVVRRQLTTYLHSAMVRDLSEAICREIMRQIPDYFDCIGNSYNALEFIRNAALLHDIGKTSITTVITTQGRMLSDEEFKAIKKHPACGYKLLNEDPDLRCYAEIANGHHKFFDGKGGYPAEFDNNASAYKPIIDIITICDCLDAATDHLGRNYKKAKNFSQVLEEFEEGKGTKYSPIIVDIIENSPRLKRELEYIVESGRVDTMYKAYLQNVL